MYKSIHRARARLALRTEEASESSNPQNIGVGGGGGGVPPLHQALSTYLPLVLVDVVGEAGLVDVLGHHLVHPRLAVPPELPGDLGRRCLGLARGRDCVLVVVVVVGGGGGVAYSCCDWVWC